MYLLLIASPPACPPPAPPSQNQHGCQSLETDGATCSCLLPALDPGPNLCSPRLGCRCPPAGQRVVVLLSLGPSFPFVLELGGLCGAALGVGDQPWALSVKHMNQLGVAEGLPEILNQHLAMFLLQYTGKS